MKKIAILLLLLFAASARGQEVDLPVKIEAKANRLTPIEIKSPPAKIAWQVIPATDIDVFREYDPDSKSIKLRFLAYREGTFHLVVATSNGKLTQQVCVIVVGTPGPEPGPKPPEPPDPPLPDTEFVRLVKAAYAQESEADKQHRADLAAIYRGAAKQSKDRQLVKVVDLFSAVQVVRKGKIGEALPKTRAVVNDYFAKSLPNTTDALFTDDRRTVAEALFSHAADALEKLR
jgi:hypothetical protein